MKFSSKCFLSLALLGIANSLTVGAYLKTNHVHITKATETSADWNDEYTGSYEGSYYNGITGTEGMTLKDQLTDLIFEHTVVSYDGLYEVYKTSDNRPEDNTVFDMYGDFHFAHSKKCGSYSKEGDCFNREHSVPQSWFSGKSPMYSDAFHLYPTDGKVNGMRSNYPFGEVGSTTYTYPFKNDIAGVCKLGTSNFTGYTGKVFEPADVYKGDFARTYFYFATAYKSKFPLSGNGTVHFTTSTTYCNLTEYSKNLFLKWHHEDPVSKKEVIRNDAVYEYQHNRNPFIDHPEYADAIWGSTPVSGDSVKVSVSSMSMTNDSDGMTISAKSSDGSQISWSSENTSIATVSSATSNSQQNITVRPVAVGTTSVVAQATINGKTLTSKCSVTVTKTLSSLSYTGAPTKTEYEAGESFDPTGLTVTATFTDASNEDVTNQVVWLPDPLTAETTEVIGQYGDKSIVVYGLSVTQSEVTGCTIDAYDLPTSYPDKESEKTAASGIKFVVYDCAMYNNGIMQFKKNSGYLYNSEALLLKSITINGITGGTLSVFGGNSKHAETQEITESNNIYDLTGYNFFTIANKTKPAATITSISIIAGGQSEYTAESFSEDLLELTNNACGLSRDDDWKDVSSSLSPIWTILSGSSYYGKLSDDEKSVLRSTVANETGTTIKEAMYRYDHIVMRYGFDNFINRSTVQNSFYRNNEKNQNTILLIGVISSFSFIALGATLLLIAKKKRRCE